LFDNYFERCFLLFGQRNEIYIYIPKLAYNFSRPYNIVIFLEKGFWYYI